MHPFSRGGYDPVPEARPNTDCTDRECLDGRTTGSHSGGPCCDRLPLILAWNEDYGGETSVPVALGDAPYVAADELAKSELPRVMLPDPQSDSSA